MLTSAPAALAVAPPDIRVIAGSVPGTPHAGTTGLVESSKPQKLSTADRRFVTAQFQKVRIGEDALDAIALLGHIHKIVHYGVGPRGCDYFDGGFVVCVWNGRVAAKRYEIKK